ncbi:MAG: hypothetical protein IH998_11595, partial [Proteobacteria bacterium]|nr:hypothetical protein [Pseudomonadota bacterium]
MATAVITPDGRYLLSAGGLSQTTPDGPPLDFSIHVTEVETNKLVRQLKGHTSCVPDVLALPDGQRAISVSWDKSIRMWDLNTGQSAQPFGPQSTGQTCASLSANGRELLVGCLDGQVRSFDTEAGTMLREFQGSSKRIGCVQFLPDSRHVAASGEDGILRVWNKKSGQLVMEFPVFANGGML